MSGIGLRLGNYLAFTHRPSPRFEALEALPLNNRLFKDVFVWFLSNLQGLGKKKICFFFKEKVCEEAQRDMQSNPGRSGQEMHILAVKVLSIYSGYLKLQFSVCRIKKPLLKALTASTVFEN